MRVLCHAYEYMSGSLGMLMVGLSVTFCHLHVSGARGSIGWYAAMRSHSVLSIPV